MMSLTDIQQAFVRRYMSGNDRVIGVRIRDIDGENVILVDLEGRENVSVPSEFSGLRVQTREADRAVLAYR